MHLSRGETLTQRIASVYGVGGFQHELYFLYAHELVEPPQQLGSFQSGFLCSLLRLQPSLQCGRLSCQP